MNYQMNFRILPIPGRVQVKLRNKLLAILSWYDKQASPYSLSFNTTSKSDLHATESVTYKTNQNLLQQTIDSESVSQIEKRQHNLFPCISECSQQQVSCVTSVWDEVIPITQEITSDCRYLLYTANFSDALIEIPQLQEAANNASWPRPSLCQIAFVSSSSPLVKNTIIANERNESITTHNLTGTDKVGNWNGKISNNGWRLVYVNQDETSLSEADFMMPKITPGSFVSKNTTKALYMEPEHLKTLPPLQVVWYLMSRQLDAKAVPAREGYKKGQFVNLPPVPEKHITLFGHSLDVSAARLDISKPTYMTKLAEFTLRQKRRDPQSQSVWPKRQIEAYSKSIRWQDQIVDFRPVDTFLMIHNLGYKRSRKLRCEWYDEQLFWENNRNLEDISMSYVMYRWRLKEWLRSTTVTDDEEPDETAGQVWGEQMMDEPISAGSPSSHYFVKLYASMRARKFY